MAYNRNYLKEKHRQCTVIGGAIMANFTSMSTGVGQLNYTFATSAASEFSVTVENESAHKSEYRERQIKRIQDRVANKPGISFGRLRSDLHLESSELRQLAREAGVTLQ